MVEQRTHGTGSVFRKKKNGKYLPNWYIAYYTRNGRQLQESTGQPLKAVAERELRKKLDSVERGVPVEQAVSFAMKTSVIPYSRNTGTTTWV